MQFDCACTRKGEGGGDATERNMTGSRIDTWKCAYERGFWSAQVTRDAGAAENGRGDSGRKRNREGKGNWKRRLDENENKVNSIRSAFLDRVFLRKLL